MDMNSILIIVGIVVLLGFAGGCVFGIIWFRKLLGKMDTKVEPKLNEVKQVTTGLALAAGQSEDLMKSVNVTMDSLDMTLVDVDEKLVKLKRVTGTVIAAGEMGSGAANQVKGKVKGAFSRKR